MKKYLLALIAFAVMSMSASAFAACGKQQMEAKVRTAVADDIRSSDDFTPDDGPAYKISAITVQELSDVQDPKSNENYYGVSVDFGPPPKANDITAQYEVTLNNLSCKITKLDRTE